jgi:nicotinate-nucleotide adenylyltransferase
MRPETTTHSRMSRRVGILGGTFDPIHVGHLDVALAAQDALNLERILLVPSWQPPHRAALPVASPFHRFAMTALAASTADAFEASDLELQAPAGPSYTIDTLARLHIDGLAPEELFFLTGADAFAEIATWKGYPHLLQHAHFVVVSRPGQPAGDIRRRVPALAAHMHDASERARDGDALPSILLVDRATRDVSSTAIRHARAEGRSIHGLVPEPVERHIVRHRLYAASPLRQLQHASGIHG